MSDRAGAASVGSAAAVISLAVHMFALLVAGGLYVKPAYPPRSINTLPLDLVVIPRSTLIDVAMLPPPDALVESRLYSGFIEPAELARVAVGEALEQRGTRENLTTSEPTAVFAPFDPRLYVDRSPVQSTLPLRGSLDPTEPLEAFPKMVAEEDRRYLAKRQVTLFGEGFTIFGDSLSHRIAGLNTSIVGRKQIMPTEGDYWENHELQQQRALAERDSILHERVRATRARIDRQRQLAPGER